jgi:pyridoxal phosphate enzyme (YggS family)
VTGPGTEDQHRRDGERAESVAANLAVVQHRIRGAAVECGRSPNDITLIVVTKTYPADDVRLLAELGVTDVGENRLSELLDKGPIAGSLGMRVHAVGRIQSNKAARFAEAADVIHSVDRADVVARLDRGRLRSGRGPLPVLVQVSLDGDPNRGGVTPDSIVALAEEIADADGLVLSGVMAVAPLGADPDAAFADLADSAELVRGVQPGATWVSAGMSGDLEAAVRHGATHVRVGAAVLGSRPPVR